jgi:cytoskeletal protein CcmA (bactofilin family)
MWRRHEEPKVSPPPQNAVTTPAAQTGPAQMHPSHQPVAQPEPPKTAVSVVSKGISIRGQVTGTEDLQINGELHGSVKLAGGRVTIGTDGIVAGDIEAREIVVRGELKGNLRAADRILVGPTGRWQGDSVSPRLAIEEGAVVSGKLEVATSGEKKSGRTGAIGSNGSTHTPQVEVQLAIGVGEKES